MSNRNRNTAARTAEQQRSDAALIAQNYKEGLCYNGVDEYGRRIYMSAEFAKDGEIVHIVFAVDQKTATVSPLFGERYAKWIAWRTSRRANRLRLCQVKGAAY